MDEELSMQERVVFIRNLGQGRDQWVRGVRWASSQPSWVARAALLTFLVVVGLPLAMLFLLAFFAAMVVFGGLALGHIAVAGVRGLFGRDAEGRENVKVIRRLDGPGDGDNVR